MNSFKTISSPIGKLTIIADTEAILALYIHDELMPLKDCSIKNDKHPILKKAEIQLNEYFSGKRLEFDLPLRPSGTLFQHMAWKALSKIPYGQVWTYGEQAKYLNSPRAQRAVGGANGKNPIPVIIPCHRVIGSTGKLTGFSGGMKMKVFLLKLEGHHIDPTSLRLLK